MAVILADLFPIGKSTAPVRPSTRTIARLAAAPTGSAPRFHFEILLATALLLGPLLADSGSETRAA